MMLEPSEEILDNDDEAENTQSDTETARPTDLSTITATGTDVTLKPGLKGVFTFPLLVTILSCGFGSNFQLGFQLGCLNTPAEPIIQWQRKSFIDIHEHDEYPRDLIWSITVSFLSLGAGISCCFVGYLADRFGRKRVLMYNNLLVAASILLMIFAYMFNNYIVMILSRIVMGFNMGINSLAPMYLSEISPINLRGTVGCIAEVFTTLGIVFSMIIGLPFLLGTKQLWISIFFISLFPTAVQLTVMGFFAPESPKYSYVLRNQFLQTYNDLKLLKGTDDVEEELDLLDSEAKIAKSHAKVGCLDIIRNDEMRWSLLLSFFFMFSVQFSGISSVAAYSTRIFQTANLTTIEAQLATCGLFTLNVLVVITSAILVLKFKFCGRRVLYLTSIAGCCVFTGIFPIVAEYIGRFASFSCILLFIASYAIGMGAISGVYINEVFAAEARATGWGMAMVSAQLFRMLVLIIFSFLESKFGPASFFLFTGSMLFSGVLGFIIFPETRNKVFERIQRDIKRRRRYLTACFRCCLRHRK